MERKALLWIDLRRTCSGSNFAAQLSARFPLVRVGGCGRIESAIACHGPGVLCFDYDTPTAEGMTALQSIKARHPSLPIIMLTDQHSEALAVWALRTRVWDYFVKPVALEALESTFLRLGDLASHREKPRQPCYPTSNALSAMESGDINRVGGQRTAPGIRHVEAYYACKVALENVADLCHLSPSAFSRVFRKEQGMTFSEYLLRYRLTRASELLVASDAPISAIAYSVGFNDACYFSRAFRRIIGIPPSQCRDNQNPTR